MPSRPPRTLFDWRRRERRSRRTAGAVILALGMLMMAAPFVAGADDLRSGETTVYRRHAGTHVVRRAEDPAGFRAQVFGGGLLVFAFGAAFTAFGRSLLREREPVQRGFDATWMLDNAQRRPLDPSA